MGNTSSCARRSQGDGGLIGRRQKLRARTENNLSQVNEQKEEAEQLLDKVGSMRPQMEKILNAVDKINEGD